MHNNLTIVTESQAPTSSLSEQEPSKHQSDHKGQLTLTTVDQKPLNQNCLEPRSTLIFLLHILHAHNIQQSIRWL